MRDELDRNGSLPQLGAVAGIEREFGTSFIYTNENGNLAIDKDVLRQFLDLTKDYVVWERSAFGWRHRQPDDAPGRMQD